MLRKPDICRKKTGIALVLLMMFFFSSAAMAQFNEKIFLKDFKTQDFKKDGTPAWKMHGRNANISGGKVVLENASTILFSSKGEVKIATGASIFNQTTKIWSSKDQVNIKGINMDISGIGFVMNTQDRKIHINKNVKATLTSLKKLRAKNENKK